MKTINHPSQISHTSYTLKDVKVKSGEDVKLKEQTDKFEAFFIKKVLDISLKNENKLFEKDAGDKIYNSMYNDAMSNSLGGKLGLSQMLFNFLKQEH